MRYCFDTFSTRSATVMGWNLTEEGRRTPEGVRVRRSRGERGRLLAVALPDRAVLVDDAVYLDALRVLTGRRLLVRLRHVHDVHRGRVRHREHALALARAEVNPAHESVFPDLALRVLVVEDV